MSSREHGGPTGAGKVHADEPETLDQGEALDQVVEIDEIDEFDEIDENDNLVETDAHVVIAGNDGLGTSDADAGVVREAADLQSSDGPGADEIVASREALRAADARVRGDEGEPANAEDGVDGDGDGDVGDAGDAGDGDAEMGGGEGAGGGLAEVGQRIRERRHGREMSLEALSAATKVPVEQLLRIEEGREGELPGPVFVKGFIRCCARVLDFDADAYIQVLDSATPVPRPSAAADRLRRSQAFARELTASLPVVGRRRILVFVGLGIFVLLVVFIALSRAQIGPALES